MADSRFGPSDCPECWGRECRGGGIRECVQRDPRPSHVAAILDTYGGMRVVVAHKPEFKHHRRHDEVLVMVPDLRVHTPIAWGDIPGVIGRAHAELDKWVEQNRPNEPYAIEAVTMYQLRRLELEQGSLDIYDIVET